MKRLLYVVLLGMIHLLGQADAAETTNDLECVKERTIELLTLGTGNGPYRQQVIEANDRWCEAYLAGDIEKLIPNDWNEPEINSKVAQKARYWRRVAAAYRTRGSRFFEDKSILPPLSEGLSNILDYFNPDTPKPGNWHPWLIVIPQNLGELGLLMENVLPPELIERLEVSLADQLQEMRLNGANAAWEARNHAYLALMQEDPDRLSRAAAQVFRPVRYTYGSGVREDFSHLFHGHIPYAGGYGAGFAQTVSQFLVLFDNTHWAPRKEKAMLIANFLLEHALYFVHQGKLGIHIVGRGYEDSRSARQLMESTLLMTAVDTPRRQELQAAAIELIQNGAPVSSYVAHLADSLPDEIPSDPFKGFRYWYCSEMGVFNGEGFHIGFRQYSNRVQDYEFLTLRGSDGWNLPYGFAYMTRNGEEWYPDALNPGLDMYYLPATTTRLGAQPVNDTKKLGIGDSGYSLNYGRSAFSGGAGSGNGGVAGFVLIPSYGDFIANKSLHFFPEGYWAIGSGICSSADTGATGPVITPVLQWPVGIDTEIQLSSGKTLLACAITRKAVTAQWILVDGIGVYFPEKTTFRMESVDGILRVWLDHGVHPYNSSYAYAFFPDTSLEAMRDFTLSPTIHPAETSPQLHAVVDGPRGTTSIVFFKPGKFQDLAINHSGIVYRELTDSGSVYALQDPLHTSDLIQLTGRAPGTLQIADDEVQVQSSTDDLLRFQIDTRFGRIYRFGSGKQGQLVAPVARVDMESMHQFKVTAENSADETLLHVQFSKETLQDEFELTLCGHKGHLLKFLTEDDIVGRDGRVITYRWNRAPADPDAIEILKQRSGDFRLYLRTDLQSSIDYFTVPAYDSEGNIDTEAILLWDNNNPNPSPRTQP